MAIVRTYSYVIPEELLEPLWALCSDQGIACASEGAGTGRVLFTVFFRFERGAGTRDETDRVVAAILKKACAAADIDSTSIMDGGRMEEREEDAYLLAYREHFKPVDIANALRIVPVVEGQEFAFEDGRETVLIEPGMAFGTGLHPTTQLCLEALVRSQLDGKTIVDVGTGSGILAIAAARRGAGMVIALDIDPVAIREARRNIKLNGVSGSVATLVGGTELLESMKDVELLVANLTAEDLETHRVALAGTSANTMILGGFLREASSRIEGLFADLGWETRERLEKNGWAALVLERVSRDPHSA